MKNLGYLVVAVTMVGCGSDVTQTANGVFPSEGFIGRDLRVEVSGDATNFNESTTVDFGAGVTVKSVTVASPTDLFADITVMPTAAEGLNDVTITEGGKQLVLSQAFALKSPVALTFEGDVSAPGLPLFTINNLDFDNQFDPTQDQNTGAFTNLTLTGPAGTDFIITGVTAFSITGQAFIDGSATSGSLMIASGPSASSVTSIVSSVSIMSKTAMPLSANTPTTGTLGPPGSSVLYSIAATGTPSLVHFTLSSTDQNAGVASAIFGTPDDSWNTVIGGQHAILAAGATVDVIVADVNGAGNYQFTINGTGEALTTAVEGSDTSNNAFATAPTATAIPFGQLTNVMSTKADIDFIKFTVSAANANKRLHIITDAGSDPNTDTAVDVVDATGTTSFLQDFTGGQGGPVDGTECGFFGCFPGDPLGENVISDQLPAGTYAVKITAGASFAASSKSYGVVLWLE